jgi:hypothetical protein
MAEAERRPPDRRALSPDNPMRGDLEALGIRFVDAELNERGEVVLRADNNAQVAALLERNYQRRLRRARVWMAIALVGLVVLCAVVANP